VTAENVNDYTMNDAKHEANRVMLSNRHLRERAENLRLEQKSYYELRAKHKHQQDQLRDEVNSLEGSILLKTSQAQEFESLRYRLSQTRITLEKQQAQEIDTFNNQLITY
jgi:tRNA A22 N-methylase